MKIYLKILFFLALPAFGFGQVVKTAAVPYTKGSGYTPNIAGSSELRVDTATSQLYWWSRDDLTWMVFRPGIDVITGSIPPAYTPVDNQSLFAVNDNDELYYYNGAAWVQIGGSGGGGIYGGSGTVPDATVATLADDFEFSGPDISSFTVTTGTTNGGQYFSNFSGATITHRDTSGSSYLEFTGTGANFNFTDGSTDRLKITGRDARYAADYSGTFSARSLVDKGYVDGAVVTDHGALIGLSDDDHTQYALLAGRATGQTLTGGTASGDDLTLRSTTDATKGDIIIADQGGNVTVGGGATASELRILEPSGSGSNYVSLKTNASAANASLSLAYATSTANTASITMGSGDTNAGVAIVPKGTGALTGHIADGTATGGNARGQYAVDWQLVRTNNTDVASGNYSTIPGGRRCEASGTYSFATGFRAKASGNGAVAFGGSGSFSVGATATGNNSFAMGTGADATATNAIAFNADASAENAIAIGTNADKAGMVSLNNMNHLTLSKLTLGTSTQELFLDGSSLRATIPSGKVWIAEVRVCARVNTVGDGTVIVSGDVYAATYKCVIQNLGGTTTLVGTVQADMAAQSVASMSGASFTITADNTNDALKIEYVPGPNEGSSTQINVYAAIWYNEF